MASVAVELMEPRMSAMIFSSGMVNVLNYPGSHDELLVILALLSYPKWV